MDNKFNTLVIFRSEELEKEYRETFDPVEKSYDKRFFLRCTNGSDGYHFVNGVRMNAEIFNKYFTCAWKYVMETFEKIGLVKPLNDGYVTTTKKAFFEVLDIHTYGRRDKFKIGWISPSINGYRENFAFYCDDPYEPVTLTDYRKQVWNRFKELVAGSDLNLETYMGYTRRGYSMAYTTNLSYR